MELTTISYGFTQVLRAEEVFVHPRWTGNLEAGYDIALLRLQRRIKDAVYPKLINPAHILSHGGLMVTLGWGYQFRRGGDSEILGLDKLQIGKPRHIDRKHCPSSVGKHLKKHMICTFRFGQHACKGEQKHLRYSPIEGTSMSLWTFSVHLSMFPFNSIVFWTIVIPKNHLEH